MTKSTKDRLILLTGITIMLFVESITDGVMYLIYL